MLQGSHWIFYGQVNPYAFDDLLSVRIAFNQTAL